MVGVGDPRVVGAVAAFVVAVAWSLASIWIGPKVGVVDAPTSSALKVHKEPTPLLGGVGVFAGIHIGTYLAGAFQPALFAATLAVLVLGLADDVVPLSPKIRLFVELAASLFLVMALDPGSGSIIWIIGGVLVMMTAINAVNLLDGLDGLVASVAVIAGLGLAWAGASGWGDAALGSVIAAAVAGFLVINWQPARVFLGDNGAYVLGMVLAFGVLDAANGNLRAVTLLVPGVLGVFLIDLVATIARRGRNRTPLFAGDRSHIYDRLRDRGWPVRIVALFAAAVQAALVLVFVGAFLA